MTEKELIEEFRSKNNNVPTFSEKFEEDLVNKLFESKNKNVKEDIEESKYYDTGVIHKKREGEWDVPINEKIEYFDSELSYEITGYRPINETQGLDFDPKPFMITGDTFSRTGNYTEYPKGGKPYSDFWDEELKKCVEGLTIGTYRITGDNYFFLNFYRMSTASDTDKAGVGRNDSFPNFYNKQYEYFHYLEMCEYVKKDCVALKSRGVGFSEIGACLGARPFITTRKFRTAYTAYTDNYVDKILSKCWWQLDWLSKNTNGGMKRLRQKIDNIKYKRASLLNDERVEFGRMAEIEGIVADKPNKVRGDRTDRLLYEEFGSNPVSLTSWTQGTALVELGGKRVGIKIGFGTGGDIGTGLSGLASIFTNPNANDVLPYRNRYTEDNKVQYTGFFIAAYEFMIDKSYIDNRGVTNTKKAKEYYNNNRNKKDGQTLLEYTSEYCFTPNEALLREGENMFDSVAIANRLTQLRIHKEGLKPQHISLIWDKSSDLFVDKVKVIPNKESKIIVYEYPELGENNIRYNNLYVAGIDSIDQGKNDSATSSDVSDFCLVIKKRIFGLNEPKYVLIYKDRPKDIREAYDNTIKILAWYNCKALIEHSKISLITYFKEKKRHDMLMKRPKATLSSNIKTKNTLIGALATEPVIHHGLELINNFINDYCHTIDIDGMLDESLRYSYSQKRKFDIIAAWSMAEMADEELLGFSPKIKNELSNQWKDIGWYTDKNGYKKFGIINGY